MRTCPTCGAQVLDNNNFCGQCGCAVPVAEGAVGSTASMAGGPVAPDGSGATVVGFGPQVAAADGGYGQNLGGTGQRPAGDDAASYANWRPEAGQPQQQRFKTPTGMFVWSIIMIFLSGIPGIVATVYTAMASGQPTKSEYDHKLSVAKVWNIVGVVLFALAIVVTIVSSVLLVRAVNNYDDYDYTALEQRLDDLDDLDVDDLFDEPIGR